MKYNSANMNTLIKSCLTLCLLWSAIGSHAQVIKKSDTDDSKKTSNQLSVRAQSLYDTQDASDADIPWMRVIYRQIDLNKEKNMPLYYPEESTENQENLFRIVMKLLANNQIPRWTRNIHRRISHQSKRNVRPLPYSVCPGKRILREESPLHGRGKRYTLQRGTLLLYLGKMDIRPPHLAGKTVHRGHLPGTSPYGRLRRRSSQIPHVLG